jgi:hypothetical protein
MTQEDQVEHMAERIWSEWLTYGDTMRIAKEFGYPPNQYGHYTALRDVEWKDLAENIKAYVRDMARQEISVAETPPTEAAQYLIALFSELDRLRPAASWSVSSHGILWDKKREKLVLLLNFGDAVSLHRLRPDDLTGDPVAAAANILSNINPDINAPEADVVMFKR